MTPRGRPDGEHPSLQRAGRATRLHVETLGSGPPLVLLHGFALHGGVFAPVLPALARRRHVLVVDLPGHGHSPPLASFTLAGVAGAVAAAVRDVAGDDEPLDVLGWSFGGHVALALAHAAPRRMRRLVLACTTPSFVAREGFPWAMSETTLRRFGDELRVAYRLTLQRFLTLQVQGSEAGRATLAALRARLFERGTPSPAVLDATLQLLVATDLRDAVRDIHTPALVLAGPRDTLAPAPAGEWLAGALPQGRFRALAGAAHAPFLSHPEAFGTAVAGFLDG
jgi:pimeloyl-[acyl-carrier protein] methyl ester esterase